MIKLIIEDDEGKTTVVPLIRDEISIGRKEGNTIRLTERNVSRRHARLLKSNGTVFIEDLNSYNGIKINGNKIAGRVAVTEGDRIQIGDYVLGLKLEGTAAVASRADKTLEDAATIKVPDGAHTGLDSETKTEQIQVTDTMATAELRTDKAVARLVCVSVNFAGMEFVLNKPVMVLGRTEDNDLVVNHRSISRHHCRIVEENGRYSVVDLQSANGVRVNGEEYKEVELRRGDHIDLGHVRLRFVGSEEDWRFDRDAVVVDTTKLPGTSPTTGIWLGVAVVALAAIAVFVWQAVQGTGSSATTDVGPTEFPRPKAHAGQPDADDALKVLASIRNAIESESWDIVLDRCSKLAGEAMEQASDDCSRARSEQGYKRAFEEAVSKTRQLAYVEALKQFNDIPDESVYARRRADDPEYREARTKYLAQMLQVISVRVREGECDQAAVEAAAVQSLIPDDTEAARLADRCEPRVATAPRPHRRPRPVKPQPQPPPSKQPQVRGPTEAEIQQANAWLDRARQTYIVGEYAQAIALARKVLKLQPSRRDALQLLGASACYTDNVPLAKMSYRKLDPRGRQLLRNVCNRKGIQLE